MLRSIALGLLIASTSAGLGLISFPARAADPTNEPAKPAKSAKRVETRLWWNDPAVVGKLSLSGEQRAQMDQLFETYLSERKNAARSKNAKRRFLEALEQGDGELARKELDSWAEGEQGLVQARGKLKMEVLSLLSEEQRKALVSAYPRLIRKNWVARSSWEPRPTPKRPVEKDEPKEPTS